MDLNGRGDIHTAEGGRPAPEPQGVPREVRAIPKPFPDGFQEDSLRDGGKCQKNIGSPVDMLVDTVSRMQKDMAILREGMTQLQTKINRPYSDILLRKTMDGGGRRDVWISDTPPATHTVKGFSLALNGRRASVGGSVGLADWLCVLGAVDNPPGGVWIDFIRCTVEDSQSIVAAPVTGSLVSPTLFSCRDANCTYRSSIFCVNCDTDWILPAGYQVLLLEHAEGGTMGADGFSMVDNRAGVTFGVELYVPWDAPEMAIDLSSTGTVPLRNVPDVFGMSGRRDGAT